jgi:SAM-dependent methyltransferase
MKWEEIYREGLKKYKDPKDWINNKLKFKKRFLDLIIKYSNQNGRILEAGCGSAVLSIFLASKGYHCHSIDIDRGMLSLAERLANDYGAPKKPTFVLESIFNMSYEKGYFDVVFSNGVLEHFEDDKIIKIIKIQLNIAKTVIIGIPTKYFNENEKAFGDERFLELKKWRELIAVSGGKIIEEASVHFLPINKRILKFRKWFRPLPHRIFVIQS